MALPRNRRDADVRAAIFREPDRVRLSPDHAGRGSAARRDHAEDTGCFSGLVTRNSDGPWPERLGDPGFLIGVS
jgi:hypothetical protein